MTTWSSFELRKLIDCHATLFFPKFNISKSENELSGIGEVLARLPVEVALGKLLLSAAVLGVLEPALTVAAGLNIQVIQIFYI